jgi:putative NADH-flavin reductase
MKVIVFGASGATGKELVRQGQGQGRAVTAFVRDRSTFPSVSAIQIMQGDVRVNDAVGIAVAGHDAVMLALGSGKLGRSDLLARGSENIVAAMRQCGVRRVIALGAAGAIPGAASRQGAMGRLLFAVLTGTLLRNVLADQGELEKNLGTSELEFTIVRPARLTNGPATGTYRVDVEALPAGWRPISRSDVAGFMLAQLNDQTFIRSGVYISR